MLICTEHFVDRKPVNTLFRLVPRTNAISRVCWLVASYIVSDGLIGSLTSDHRLPWRAGSGSLPGRWANLGSLTSTQCVLRRLADWRRLRSIRLIFLASRCSC